MIGQFSLDKALLKNCTRYYQRELQRPKFDFYEKIRQSDKTATVLSPESNTAVHAVEGFLGTYKALKDTLTQNEFFGAVTRQKQSFVNALALYAGAVYGLSFLGKSQGFVMNGAIDFDKSEYELADELMGSYLALLEKHTPDTAAKSFLEWVLEQAKTAQQDPEYSGLAEQSRDLSVNLNGIVFHGFSHDYQTQQTHFKTSLDDIVGNQEMISVLLQGLRDALKYDAGQRKNVMAEFGGFQHTFTFFGSPGNGKTCTIEACLNEAQRLAEKYGKQLVVKNITNRFKSEYFSKSVQNLQGVFDEVNKGGMVYVLIADDIDTIFFSRESSERENENKAILGAVLNFLEGLESPNLGNYVFIATTNNPLGYDDALQRRLKEGQVEVKGPQTPQDFAKLFRVKLGSGIKQGYVSVQDWEKIGEECRGLKGSDIANIAKAVAAFSRKNEPEEIIGLGYAEQLAGLSSCFDLIDDAAILEAVSQYKTLEKKKGDKNASKLQPGLCELDRAC